jgi:4-aminobutyrate aminotransferase-like enzyme
MTTKNNENKAAADDLLARDEKYVIRPWTGTGEPVPAVKGEGCILTDAYGTEFLDFTSGYFVNQAGHCHPKVVAAATEQLGKVTQVSGRHTTRPVVDLAERLVQLTPKSVDKVFFTTGGSESNEFALKMVRQKSGKTDMASLENAYHGLSLGVLQGCSAKKYRDTAGCEMPDNFTRLPTAYCYRCEFQNDCKVQCLNGVDAQLAAKPNTAALIAEPVQAVGGIIPPQSWWSRLDEIRKKHNLFLILDEIQTGIGRTGAMFAAEHYGLEPDIITAGKGLSGGVGSLAAVIASNELVDGFYGGTTPTSAGNAVSAAAGLALVGVLEEEKLVENAKNMGEHFTGAVAELNDPWVGDIRFKGLLGGVELVADRESKEILPKPLVVTVKDRLFDEGMLITVSGLHGNVLRLQPPLCISAKQIDSFVAVLKRVLVQVRKEAA